MATRPGVVYHEDGKIVAETHSPERDNAVLHRTVMDGSEECGEP